MKRALIVFFIALGFFVLASVQTIGAAVDYPGEWVCTGIDQGDGVIQSEFQGMAASELMKLTLDAGGSLLVASGGEQIPGTWTEHENGITAIIEDQRVEFPLIEGKLTTTESSTTLYLEKAGEAPKSGGLLSRLTSGKYTGRWISVAVDSGDGERKAEMDGKSVRGMLALTIHTDGMVTLSSMGRDEQGTWEGISGGIRVDLSGEMMDLLLADGQLASENDGVTIYFDRDTAEPAVISEQTQPDAFIGQWEAERYEMAGYSFEASMLFPNGCVLVLREDGTGEASLTKDYQEQFTWTLSGDTITIAGSYVFSSPEWDAQAEELSMFYGSSDVSLIFKRSDAGEPAMLSSPAPTETPAAPQPAAEPSPEPKTEQPEAVSGETVTSLFGARLPGGGGWTENVSMRSDSETYAYMRFELKDDEGGNVASIAITASSEGVRNYRDKIKILEGYAADLGKGALEEAIIGGLRFLGTPYEKWGWKYLEYTARVVESGITLTILAEQPEQMGDVLQELLDSIVFTLPVLTPPNVDPPMPQDGTPCLPLPAPVTIGDRELTAVFLKAKDPIILDNIFGNSILLSGQRLYVLAGKTLYAYLMESGSLVPDPSFGGGRITLEDEFEYLAQGKDGLLFVSHGIYNILAVKDGAVVQDNNLSGYLVTHPSGEWGLTFWANADPMLVKIEGSALTAKPWVLSRLSDAAARQGRFSMISCAAISDQRIYVAGTDALAGDAQRVAVYDLEGNELFQLGAADWMADDAFGSVTGIVETEDTILVQDGNFRALKLFTLEGEYIGQAECDPLLGTDYPWLASITPNEGGALVAAAQSREDESADELLIFEVKGF
ncbi:MAG: hypothetical protein PHP02_09045 [Eubacteriales bacterium]|nr:hypothetical protein [Eubacteriales bacterium]